LLRASFTGFWLGILGRDTIYLIDKYYYDSQKRYHEQGYNRGGLFTWEHKVIDTYFNQCKRILVGGAGGGREVLALCKLGYEVDGFECHPELAAFANKVLKKEGLLAKVQLVPRDECPNSNKMYNGLIVGWGVYMHIQGKKKRITFLKNMRAKVFQQSPILVSFYYRNQNARYFRVTAAIANGLRWILGRSPVELGDSLDPNYAHNFTEAEISEELRQGGFEIISYKSEEYGHAVAVASDTEGS
jgi:hypothetical protein